MNSIKRRCQILGIEREEYLHTLVAIPPSHQINGDVLSYEDEGLSIESIRRIKLLDDLIEEVVTAFDSEILARNWFSRPRMCLKGKSMSDLLRKGSKISELHTFLMTISE